MVTFVIFCPILIFLTKVYLHWMVGVAFSIGFFEFIWDSWFVRKIFIKTMLRLRLDNDSTELKNHNWNIYTKFMTSSLLVFTLSTSLLFILTTLLLIDYFINPTIKDPSKVLIEPLMTRFHFDKFQMTVICFGAYLLGTNIF